MSVRPLSHERGLASAADGSPGGTAAPAVNPWLLRGKAQPGAELRLFCLPYAGAGGVVYARWLQAFPAILDVCPITPPGRLGRFREEPIVEMRAYIGALCDAIADLLDVPYGIFGYSMGAPVGFELVRELRRRGLQQPRQLMVAASRAPHVAARIPVTKGLSDEEFTDFLCRRYSALPPAVLENDELRPLVLRTMRADLSVLATYKYVDEPKLSCPITAFGGHADTDCSAHALSRWAELSSGDFALRMFAGGHFFLREQGAALVEAVRACLLSERAPTVALT